MATTYIKIGTTTTQANRLLTLCAELTSARAHLSQVKETMDSMVNGADYSMLAEEFGLADATQAQTLYNAVAGLKATWEAPDFNLLLLTRKVGN